MLSKAPPKVQNHSGGRQRRRAAFPAALLLMTAALLLSILFSVSVGVAGGSIPILVHTLLHPGETSEIGRIMLQMRMPRALAACFTGAAFALAGGVIQGVTRNPLADAGLLGINAGAGFLIALTAVIFPALSALGTMLAAFLGAALAAAMVYGLGMGKRKSGPVRLILAGSAVSALLTSLSQGISLTFGLSKDLSFWTAGSLSGITWKSLLLTLPWIIAAGAFSLLLSDKLSALALGEESAAGLGVNVRGVRAAGLAAVLLLAGSAVSLVGGISFLGLIVPHIARSLAGEDYRRLLPASALLGAILLVLADVAARTLNAPFDTPVGALVSAIGVPVFLLLTYRRKGAAL
jgi:iron complex transport system permease protein